MILIIVFEPLSLEVLVVSMTINVRTLLLSFSYQFRMLSSSQELSNHSSCLRQKQKLKIYFISFQESNKH